MVDVVDMPVLCNVTGDVSGCGWCERREFGGAVAPYSVECVGAVKVFGVWFFVFEA